MIGAMGPSGTRRTSTRPLLYERVAADVADLIARGTYRVGERIPSVRELSRQLRVSINTVNEAYAQLENRRLVEARPQSGYYVACPLPEPEGAAETAAPRRLAATSVELGSEPLAVMRTLADPQLVPLGRGVPNPELLPVDKLSRMLATEARRFRLESVTYAGAKGLKRLRIQIAKRSLDAGCRLTPDDVVVTSGCVEAVTLALQATCRPGDTVAIGSPVYYTFLNSIQELGLKILEIPSTPREGMSVEVLAYALRHHAVRACLVIANFNNPLGSVMPDERKAELVRLLRSHDLPLIEDDVYGELGFGPHRPSAAKAYDDAGLVLYCSSFSKTLAPGYRVGWIAPGRYLERVQRLKSVFSLASASPTQLAVAEFLVSGGYDRHLRAMRKTYAAQLAHVRAAIARWFPAGTRVTRPEGGFVVWVELPPEVDGLAVHELALRKGIAVAPGTLFTTSDRFRSCIRVSGAFWSDRIRDALRTVGGIASGLAGGGP
jgi:DNA-binding transcriptional MocR family regulator